MIILLLMLLIRWSSEIIIPQGMLTLLFANVTADNPDQEISLYINGAKKNAQIVIWTIKNDAITTEWRMKNYTKIFMDPGGSIWIANIDENYEGRYTLHNSLRPDVELTILGNLMGEIWNIQKWLRDDHACIMQELDRRTSKSASDITIQVLYLVCLPLVLLCHLYFMFERHQRYYRKSEPRKVRLKQGGLLPAPV